MFTVTVPNAFNDAAALIAKQAVEDAVKRLSQMYGFNADEALDALLSGGVQVKPKIDVIPRNAMPWCGDVLGDKCKAIAYNSGLFTQCPQNKKDGDWCTKCAKQVAEHGTPNNGDVDQRLACDLMSYAVGKRHVCSYLKYMDRHGYTREQVEESAKVYGLTIDPAQFECKSRGRPKTTAMHMTTPVQDLPVPDTKESEADAEEAEAAEAPAEAAEAEAPKTETTEPDEDELEEEEVGEHTAEEIEKMVIGDLRKLAESLGIATKENGKPIAPKQLKAIVRGHLNL